MSVSESRCEFCGHVRRTYTRRLPRADLPSLIRLWHCNEEGQEWVHVRELQGKSGGGDFAKYRYWDLIRARMNDDASKKDSGIWSLTPRGVAFLLGDLSIHSHAVVVDGECVGFSGTLLSVYAAFRTSGFDYAELMSPPSGWNFTTLDAVEGLDERQIRMHGGGQVDGKTTGDH